MKTNALTLHELSDEYPIIIQLVHLEGASISIEAGTCWLFSPIDVRLA